MRNKYFKECWVFHIYFIQTIYSISNNNYHIFSTPTWALTILTQLTHTNYKKQRKSKKDNPLTLNNIRMFSFIFLQYLHLVDSSPGPYHGSRSTARANPPVALRSLNHKPSVDIIIFIQMGKPILQVEELVWEEATSTTMEKLKFTRSLRRTWWATCTPDDPEEPENSRQTYRPGHTIFPS